MLDDLENEIEEEEDANAEEEEAEETSDEEEELDEDGNPIAKKKEAWQMTDEDDEQASSDKVPLGAHINMKKKLKGRLSDQGDEIERLKAENKELKAGIAPANKKAPDSMTKRLPLQGLKALLKTRRLKPSRRRLLKSSMRMLMPIMTGLQHC
jgi:hypothetical protein